MALLLPGGVAAQQSLPSTSPSSQAMPGAITAEQDMPDTTAAPPAGAAKQDPIIVMGRQAPDPETVRSLSRAITPNVAPDDPLARFNEPVCFITSGLAQATLEQIGDRLAADAEQAGLRLAGAGCHPNVAILFVNGVEATLKRLEHDRAVLFGTRKPADLHDLSRQPGPVRAWNNIRMVQVPLNEGSRLVSDVRMDIVNAIVLVERSAVVGRTTNQIADYAVMRALAVIRPRRAIGRDTILSLFDTAGSPPAEMTVFDRGYLRGLYNGAGNQLANVQQGRIVQGIVNQTNVHTKTNVSADTSAH
ncbi:hypothetical protein [Sphingomonas sp. 22176]|uniref:hypothetical protein n=1 Tax=Sphingomonas sp. 22176 TaxID=3453884 RepID=UPI003F8772C0